MISITEYAVLYLTDSKLTPRHFYNGLLEQLGLETWFYRGDARKKLHQEIEIMRGVPAGVRICGILWRTTSSPSGGL